MFRDSYTEQMESQLFSQWDKFDTGEEDYTAIVDFLNDATSFQSFGDGLLSFMSKRGIELTAETAFKYIDDACSKARIDKSEIGSTNTLKSWFTEIHLTGCSYTVTWPNAHWMRFVRYLPKCRWKQNKRQRKIQIEFSRWYASAAYSGETEKLFRLYVFMSDTDEQMEDHLLALSSCLLALYAQYEVPEFMWFVGWENQAYFYPKILQALSFAKSEIAEENTVIDGKQIYDQPLTLYAANLCCDFCRMQLENLEFSECTDEIVDNVVAVYGASLWAIVWHEVHQKEKPSIRRQVEALMNLEGNGGISNSVFMQSSSICENGNYHDGLECDYIRGIVPHRNERHWTLFVSMHLALGIYFDSVLNVEKHTRQYQEYNQALNRMYAEILRAGIGYDHFYDFYDVPEEKAKKLFTAGAIWTAEKHFNHADGIEHFDENNTLAYFVEVVQTLQSTKNPFPLYKLLLNHDFRISDKLKEMLIGWNMGQQIAEDSRLTNAQKRQLAVFAINNWFYEGGRSNFQKHCIDSALKSNVIPEKTKYGIYNAIARKYIEDIVKFGYGWDHCDLDELPAFSEEYALMKCYYPLQNCSPNKISGVADAIYSCQNKMQLEYSTEEFAQSYARYVSEISVEKLTEWDKHWGYIGVAHIVGKRAGASIVMECLAPKLLVYFSQNDPAEYFDTAYEIRRIRKKYPESYDCMVDCYYCHQLVSIEEELCPHCHKEL